MRTVSVLSTSDALADQFARCCAQYDEIRMAVAWCGSPEKVLPFHHLENFQGRKKVTIGVSFAHTHPDSFDWLKSKVGADYRVFKDGPDLFHPKVYFFTKGNEYALFVGSSNFTYGGFFSNIEVNTFIEGELDAKENADIRQLQEKLDQWHTPDLSFRPTKAWIEKYRAEYNAACKTAKRKGISTPARSEEDIGRASWLKKARWEVYHQKVLRGLRQHKRNTQGYHYVLDSAQKLIPLPWKVSHFSHIEKRRVIGGFGKDLGWLGNVGASGMFRQLLAGDDKKQLRSIVRALNAASELNPPISWKELEGVLDDLVAKGFTMKIWGRLLCLSRPDLYCTVSSNSVRSSLSDTLNLPQVAFEKPKGYTELIRLAHHSPWFNSPSPADLDERAIWDRRMAFMDAIFY